MPYRSSDIPSGTEKVPAHGRAIYRAAFNSAHAGGAEEANAHAIAWAAVKKKFKKKGDRWIAKDYNPYHEPAGSSEGGRFASSGEDYGYSPKDAARYRVLKSQWSQINNHLLRYSASGRADAPEAQSDIVKMGKIVDAMHQLHADPGGPEGIKLPGGPRDVTVVGAGPGGLQAAIAGGAEGLDTLIIEKDVVAGGQAKYSSRVENFIGFPIGVSGETLTKNGFDQVNRLGAEAKLGVGVTGMGYDKATGLKRLSLTNGDVIESRTVILAGGVQFRKPDFPGALGSGVIVGDSKALTAHCAGGDAVVQGGSNGAGQAALAAAEKATHVYVISRSALDKGMSDYVIAGLRNHPKISILENETITKLNRDAQGNPKTIETKSGKVLPCKACGIFTGSVPNTDWVGSRVNRVKGFVATNNNYESTMPGVYAIGDMKVGGAGRIIVAAGEGMMALKNAHAYLDKAAKAAKTARLGVKAADGVRFAIDNDSNFTAQLVALDLANPWLSSTIEGKEFGRPRRLKDYNPDQPREPSGSSEGGRFAGGGSKPSLAGEGGAHPAHGKHPGPGYSASARVDENGVIQTTSVFDAQKALSEGRKVDLDQPEKVSVLIDKLGADAAKMIEHGEKSPNYNLCDVMIHGTSLFCHENKGIERVKMPQLDKQQTKDFQKYLKDQGYKIEKDEVRSDHLHATQKEISAQKVGIVARKIEAADGKVKRLIVSKDNYILDGHHNWAAKLGLDYRDGTAKGDTKMKVSRVNISITDLLKEADKFTGGKGRKGTGDAIDWAAVFDDAAFYEDTNMDNTDRGFSTEKRKSLAKTGAAMKGGGYPIENEGDLKNAIQAIGRAKNPAATKAHIKTRAKSLGLTKLIPENWDAEMITTETYKTYDAWMEIDDIKPCPKCDGAGKDDGGFKCTRCDGAGYVADAKNDDDCDPEEDDPEADDYCEDGIERTTSSVQLNDTFIMDGVRRTRDGYLVADARIARTGVQEYAGHELGMPDKKIVRVYRPPEEVFSNASMHSLAHKPITLLHPPVMVDSENWDEYAVGQTGDEVTRDGDCVRVPMVIMDGKAIKAFEKHGVRELSVGYSTDLKWGRGRTPDGEVYDAKQTAIRGNHLAVVPAARGGSRLRIGDDTGGTDMTVRVLIDGQTITFDDELVAKHVQNFIGSLQAQNVGLQKLIDAKKKNGNGNGDDDADEEQENEKKTRAEKDAALAAMKGENVALKKQLEDATAKMSGKAIDAAVKERIDLLMKASAAMDGKADFEGKSDADVRRTVVNAAMGDAAKDLTDAEMVGAFKAVTANLKPKAGVDRLADSLSLLGQGGGSDRTSPQAMRDAAYEEHVKNLTNAWRPRAAQ